MTPAASDISVLYVEDESSIRSTLEMFLRQRFNNVMTAGSAAEGLRIYHEKHPEIVLTDICMPDMNGIEMTKIILDEDRSAKVIITSAYNEADYLMQAINLGIQHYLLKPVEFPLLSKILEHCIASIRDGRSSAEQQQKLSGAFKLMSTLMDQSEIIGQSAKDLCLGVEYHMDKTIEALFAYRNQPGYNSPSSVIIGSLGKHPEQQEWYWYDGSAPDKVNKFHYIDHPKLGLRNDFHEHSLYCINRDDPLPSDPLLTAFIDHLDHNDTEFRNLVWYQNGKCIICALDYNDKVTPFDASVIKGLAVQIVYLQSISKQCSETDEAFGYTISSLARAAEANEADSITHIQRVGSYSAAIASAMGFSDDLSERLRQQSHLHDVGKIHISPQVLRRIGRYSNQERNIMQEHTIIGARIIGAHPRLSMARRIALHHHERWDGSGYPFGLIGDYIPLEARIVNLADTYDALRSRKSYKPACSHDEACKAIFEGDQVTRPEQFDPAILKAFRKAEQQFGKLFEQKDFNTCSSPQKKDTGTEKNSAPASEILEISH